MVLLHPDRYTTRNIYPKKKGVVVHDAESGDGAATNLIHLLQQPGDRTTKAGAKYGSGYHAVTTGDDKYVEVADASCGPYAAPPANESFWHICMPGFASQTREQWLDELSRNHITGVAQFIVDKQKIDGFPLTKLTVPQLQLGHSGYCSHWDVSLAWKRSTHTDPGANFPWDILAADIKSLLVEPTPEDEEMGRLVRFTDDAAVFVQNGNFMTFAISQDVINALYADGSIDRNSAKDINPSTRKTFTLVGPEPKYDGATSSHRLYARDFAAWIQPV